MLEPNNNHKYEYNFREGTILDRYGNEMDGVDDYIMEFNDLIEYIRMLEKDRISLRKQLKNLKELSCEQR